MAKTRAYLLTKLFLFIFIAITLRLFYWQVLAGNKLQALGLLQYQADRRLEPLRGEIYSSDGYPLASNHKRYTLFAYKPSVTQSYEDISQKLGVVFASESARTNIYTALNQDKSWVALKRGLNDDYKDRIESLKINGLGFDESYVRGYPESSLSAHLLGFVGSDKEGYPTGYFGLEGFYNRELTGKPGFIKGEADVFGRPILYGSYEANQKTDGRSLKLHLDRGLQLMIETKLKQGLNKYNALSGEVTVMDPNSGAILALASFPNYAPDSFYQFGQESYRIPAIADLYEPGSTFKTIVMASAVNENLITPDTVCDDTCNGPVQIGKYTIRTWDNHYYPGETMREVLERSDNTGMIFVANKLGSEKFIEYLQKFGLFEKTGIDLESETVGLLKPRWGDIDVATASFGQGIAINSMQMLTGVGAIANNGRRMEPHVVAAIKAADGTESPIAPKIIQTVISPESAAIMTDLMVTAAKHGEAQWAIPSWLKIAGKTGTAQIPISGHYDENRTMASFIGFAPADKPKFVMLVKLREPQTSPWASETAAPLWVDIAKNIYLYYNLAP